MNAVERIKANREEIVKQLIENLTVEQNIIPNHWNAIRPINATNSITYSGINRLQLTLQTIINEYDDPRWCTYVQAKSKGWKIKKGAKGVLCEKWIFTKEVDVLDQNGNTKYDMNGKKVRQLINLKHPYVNYFIVFNAAQIDGIPEASVAPSLNYINSTIHTFTKSSLCPIKNIAIGKAYYSPNIDEIHLPPKSAFRSGEAYLSVLIHEMSHSTGHPSRLNRTFHQYGTPAYAFEELNAEIASMFTRQSISLKLNSDAETEIQAMHYSYIKSWMTLLENNPDALFQSCRIASQISDYLMANYERQREREREFVHQQSPYQEMEESQ